VCLRKAQSVSVSIQGLFIITLGVIAGQAGSAVINIKTTSFNNVHTYNNNNTVATNKQQQATMISNFFVLSPRGDTILAKQYRQSHKLGTPELGAHERSHTEALFRRIKFWNDVATPTTSTTTALFAETDNSTATTNAAATEVFSAEPESNNSSSANEGGSGSGASGGGGIGIVPALAGDAPPVLLMPDGLTYFHVKRNGLIFGASSARNVSPNTVIEVCAG
jgi:hypothetical protein